MNDSNGLISPYPQVQQVLTAEEKKELQDIQEFLNNAYKDELQDTNRTTESSTQQLQDTNRTTESSTQQVASVVQPILTVEEQIQKMISNKIQSLLSLISFNSMQFIDFTKNKDKRILLISSQKMHSKLQNFLSQPEVILTFYLHTTQNSFTSKNKHLAKHPYYGKPIVVYARTHKKCGARMDALEFKHRSGQTSASEPMTLNFRNTGEQTSNYITRKFNNLWWPVHDLRHILWIGMYGRMQYQINSCQDNDVKKQQWDEKVQQLVADKEKEIALEKRTEERTEERQTDPQEQPVKKKRKQSRKQTQTTEQSNNQNTATTTDHIIRLIPPPPHVMQKNQSSVLSPRLQELQELQEPQSFINNACDATTAVDTLPFDVEGWF